MDKVKSQSSVSGKPPAAARAAQPQTLVTNPTRSLAGAPLVVLAGCATMIPPADDTPPRLKLTIIGPGLGTRTMTNPPQARWLGEGGVQLFDLLPDTGYNFRLVVLDFEAEGDDFGGTPGRRNQTFMIVQVAVGAGRP